MKKMLILTISTMLCLCAAAAFADITVVSTKGTVAYSLGGKWLPMEAGMKIKDGAKISTGVKSTAVLKLMNSTVTVRPLSMMKIYEDRIVDDTSETKIAVRRGSMKAEVNRSQEVKTVFKVATPVATSSVRGTIQDVTSGFNETTFRTLGGSIEVQNRLGHTSVISGNLDFRQGRDGSTSVLRAREFRNSIADPNLSPEENDALQRQGEDVPDGPGGASDMGQSVFQRGGGASGSVIIDLAWP